MSDTTLLVSKINDFVWGMPLIVLITFVGILFTIKTGFVQVFQLKNAFKFLFKGDKSGCGEVSGFNALCTSLSATIGTGNIVGVATAILTGGPGSIFWMICAAVLGMATTYAEGFLSIKYRKIGKDGKVLGGPFYYIEKGMGKRWKWLAVLFCIFTLFASVFGIGTITQINAITSSVNRFFDPNNIHTVSVFGNRYSITVIFTGVVITSLAAPVIFGGIKSISKFSIIFVPFMASFYFIFCFIIIISNYDKIPMAISLIINSAFNPSSFTGGVVGSIFMCIQRGVARGVFSNEAGLGTTPIASATAKTNDAVKQGLICMTGPFIDTIVICTITGLVIIVTGRWNTSVIDAVDLTFYAFETGLPFKREISSLFLMMSLVFFAFATIVGWNFYGERCLSYLSSDNRMIIMIYRVIYISSVFFGIFLSSSFVWIIADIFNALMAIPNLTALVFLRKKVYNETKSFIEKNKILLKK